jgi:pentatricopeptide repeat protein
MLVKFQHLDANCFHILGSSRNSPSTGASVFPLDQVELNNKKHREQIVVECPNGEFKRVGGVHRQSHDRRTGVVHEPGVKKLSVVKNPDRKQRGSTWDSGRIVKRRNFEVELRSGSENGLLEKVHSRCLTKWVNYGGCIPAILKALDTVEDLDEALRPWEDKIGNKERSIILKEQLSWERALEIFEWFKRKGCYELNVIHYNIMLRILGKARKWSHVESLWDEMNVKGIAPINSTYGTLIDVYSKGGLKEQALLWLERMRTKGWNPMRLLWRLLCSCIRRQESFEKPRTFSRSGHLVNL